MVNGCSATLAGGGVAGRTGNPVGVAPGIVNALSEANSNRHACPSRQSHFRSRHSQFRKRIASQIGIVAAVVSDRSRRGSARLPASAVSAYAGRPAIRSGFSTKIGMIGRAEDRTIGFDGDGKLSTKASAKRGEAICIHRAWST